MTLEVKYKGKWLTFYPLKFDLIAEEYIDPRPVVEILAQEKIYGKVIIGAVGFQPAWMYDSWKRNDVRLKEK